MKIIDENGRLFGRINIIDLFVVIFLIGLIPLFFYSKRLAVKKPVMIEEEIETEVTCRAIKIKPDIAGLISVGDQEADKDGKITGEVIAMGSVEAYFRRFDFGSGQFRILPHLSFKEVPLKLRLRAGVVDNKVCYKGKPVAAGSSFVFKTAKYSLVCMPAENIFGKWVEVKVRFPGVSPELSAMINGGHAEKNKDGKIIGKLNEVINMSPSQLSTLKAEEGRVVFINDPTHNDIIAGMELYCNEEDGTLYFKNFPVKVGGQITFSADLYIISGMIIDIKKNE